MIAMEHGSFSALLIFQRMRAVTRRFDYACDIGNAPRRVYIWDSTLRRSLVTPMAVTSPPAPAPWMIRGLLPYRLV